MDRNVLKKLAVVFVIFIICMNFWLDIGSTHLLNYMMRSRAVAIAYRDFERMALIIPAMFVLLVCIVILKICFDSEDPEEGEE